MAVTREIISAVAALITDDPILFEESSQVQDVASEIANELSGTWLDPDHFYNQAGAVAFVFREDVGLILGDDKDYHGLMALKHNLLPQEEYDDASGDPNLIRELLLERGYLLGRIGWHRSIIDDRLYKVAVVSFWNQHRDEYHNLDECILQIENKEGAIPQGMTPDLPLFISSPIHKTIPYHPEHSEPTHEISADELDDIELRKQLHTMTIGKREAMNKLGVGGQKPHPMQSAMDRAGIRIPGQKWWAMNSESVERQISEWQYDGGDDPQERYTNPDDLYNESPDFVTFIYTSDHKLYTVSYDDTPNTHFDLTRRDPELANRYLDLRLYKRRDREAVDLFGRVGTLDGKTVVSFWNNIPEQFSELLTPCLEALEQHGLIGGNGAVLSTPIHGTVPIFDDTGYDDVEELSPEDEEMLELQKNLHLMRGQAKQDAMRKLGVGGGGRPHPIQSAMDDAGLRMPGQKWWAMNSESVGQISLVDRVASLLTDDPDVFCDLS